MYLYVFLKIPILSCPTPVGKRAPVYVKLSIGEKILIFWLNFFIKIVMGVLALIRVAWQLVK